MDESEVQVAEGAQGRNVWLFLTPGSYLPGIAVTIFTS